MSNKWYPLRDCPIDGDTSGRCRIKHDGNKECIACMGLSAAKIGTVINGYKCVKSDSGKHIYPGSFWVLDNSAEWSREQKEQWEEERRQRQQEQAREEQERLQRSLAALKRHQGYTLLLQQLDRHPEDKKDLLQRGFTEEQIERIGFKSIRKYQRLPINLDPQLPGVSKCGSYLLNAHDGYLCPVRNHEGLIIGLQYRLRQLPEGDTNRYRFFSSGSGEGVAVLKMPNGENPIGFYMPFSGKPDGIALVDSLGPKAFLTAERLNKIVIGSAGGQFAASPQLFSLYLAKAQEIVGSSLVTFYPDAGDVINGLVCRKLQLTADLVADFGYAINFAWWGQITKEHCDIDELPVEQFNEIQYLSPTEFFDLAQGKEAWEGKASSGKPKSIQSQPGLKKNSLSGGALPVRAESAHSSTESSRKIVTTSGTRSNGSSAIQPPGIGADMDGLTNPAVLSSSSSEPDWGNDNESNGDREITKEEWEAKQKELPRAIALSSTKAGEVLVTDKAPRAERREFDRKLKQVEEKFKEAGEKKKDTKAGFSATTKLTPRIITGEEQYPKLEFNCLKEDNPEFEEKIRQAQRKLRSLSYKVDFSAPKNERYLPKALANQLPKSGIIGIKAPKGSGKSFLLKRIIALAKKQGIPVLSITPRIALGREQAFKWEITWIDDYGEIRTQAQDTANEISELADRKKKAKEKLGDLNQVQIDLLNPNQMAQVEQERQNLATEIEDLDQQIENVNMSSIYTLGLCWDSLWRTEKRDMKNSLIIIDEAELGFTHLATSATCRGNRPSLLQVFSNKITECLMSGGRLILSDADLTDVSIDYVRELLQIPLQPYIVVHDYKGKDTRWIIDFRSGSRGNTLDLLMERIKAGEHVAVTTDSQAEAEALERKILAECPELCAFIDAESGEITPEARSEDGICLIRMDSKISQTEAGKDFLSKPNEAILKWRPQVLIYTPTMGVGVSIDESTVRTDFEIDVPYFDVVFGLFFGTIEPSQCRQQLARVRANVERVVWAKESNKSLEGCSSFLPEEISRNLFKYHQYNLNPIDIARAAAGMDADDGEVMEQLIELFKKSYDRKQKCWNNPHLNLYAKLKARRNYGLWNLAALLREELEDEGHKVISIEGSKSKLTSQLREIKDEIKLEEATKISESTPLPTVEDARKVLNSISSTKEDRYAARKTLLADELPGVELTPQLIFEVVLKDGSRWLGRQKLYWHLRNTEATKANDAERLIGQFKKFTNGVPYMPDTRTLKPKIEAIQRSGVLNWLDLKDREKTYTSDSKEAKKFLRKALEAKELLRAAFNLSVTPKTNPIRLAGKLAEKIGFDLKPVTKNRSEKNFKLIPQHLTHTDGSPVLFATRDEILEALDRRWKLRKQNSTQTHTQQGFDPKGEPHILLNKKVAHPYPYTQENRLSSEYECLFEESQGKTEGVGAAAPVGEYECSSDAPSALDLLIERLTTADSQSQVLNAVAGVADRVEDALLFLSLQQRQRIKDWLATDNQQVSPDAPIEPLEASLEPGKPCWYLYAGKWVKALLLRLPSDLGEPFAAGQVEISPGFQPLVLSRKFLEPCCG